LSLSPKRAKFQRYIAKETFSNSGLNGGGVGEMCVFNEKLAISRKQWEIRLMLLWFT